MTRFIAAYDTEALPSPDRKLPSCIEACRAIVDAHQRHQMPATFFIVGTALEASVDEYRRLLDDPLFEIASHTWSHRLLKDNPFCGKAVTGTALRDEVMRGKEAVEKHFPDRPCIGLRPACSFVDGLSNAPEVLALVDEAGYEYVSSVAWGPDYTLPAPLNQHTTYADEGYPNLHEYPCHGWHDNVLKSHSRPGYWQEPRRLLAYPPQFPEAIPPEPIDTPDEEFRYNNKVFIDRACEQRLDYVSLIWHPWSLAGFDPQMRMLDMTFDYVREAKLEATTFAQMHRETVSA